MPEAADSLPCVSTAVTAYWYVAPVCGSGSWYQEEVSGLSPFSRFAAVSASGLPTVERYTLYPARSASEFPYQERLTFSE